uniref:Uncharacterized protein n=1 Tax=Steinernema glaseri TaxID=37863 RepID=A0A1I8AEV0_9BILA
MDNITLRIEQTFCSFNVRAEGAHSPFLNHVPRHKNHTPAFSTPSGQEVLECDSSKQTPNHAPWNVTHTGKRLTECRQFGRPSDKTHTSGPRDVLQPTRRFDRGAGYLYGAREGFPSTTSSTLFAKSAEVCDDRAGTSFGRGTNIASSSKAPRT